MMSGEFPQRDPNATRNMSISQTREWLATLTPDEAEQWCQGFREIAIQQWNQCNNSFRALFDRLNLYNINELDLFDINTDRDSSSSAEAYIRVWRDKNGDNDTYNTSRLLRYKGEIIDRKETESFSDTYTYQFGPTNDHIAEIQLREDLDGQIKLAKSDGELIDNKTLFETAVLICALETEVLPSLERTKARLAELWSAVLDIETT